MTQPYDAVIFDLDGTLVDSESIIIEAAEIAFAVHGMDMDHALIHSMVGVDAIESRKRLAKALGPITADAFTAIWDREIAKGYARGMPLKPGVHEVLSGIVALGLPVALCTSSGRTNAESKLVRTDIARYFTATITLDDVTNPKPAPEPYLNAARDLNVSPQRCLAFEDSETGARAAMAAGMTVVQVPDILAVSGDFSHFVAETLLQGVEAAGLRLPI